MNNTLLSLGAVSLLITCSSFKQPDVLRINDENLMHEVRVTPYPLSGSVAKVNPPRFMWPDEVPYLGEALDGVPGKAGKKQPALYQIRISQDSTFRKDVIEGERAWAFFNPFKPLAPGKWYWQYAYVSADYSKKWSPIYNVTIDKNTRVFNPPSLETVRTGFSTRHPRVLLNADDWNSLIHRNLDNPETAGYFKRARRCFSHPLKHLNEEIDTTNVVTLTNQVQRKSALIRESRKIVDREEPNVEALVRAYLLTKDQKYYREGMNRLTEILSWQDSKYLAGDFNLGTLLSMSTSAYDAFYNIMTDEEKQLLLTNIRKFGNKFYKNFVNHLENRIADNHVWQMTFRIFTMAAWATYGEIDEADTWTDYCYNEWVSRMPGLFDDGAWHNGDSYFHVNIRTLIEVPAFYSRITGFDFFNDPWYDNNAMYVIYQQPPFSMSGGHGNSHESNLSPKGNRIGYADALARERQNPWAMAYKHEIMQEDPDIMSKAFENKPADLTWYRCISTRTLPEYSVSLADLPCCKVFKDNGTALMNTDLGHHNQNAMLSFRSSPYGATSHALANQNAFNTFYGGKAIFYSSGHRTGFTDDHCMYAYRNTRAHNSILVNGMGQKIGTEGYGWVPRYYEGNELSYVVGDASNAYGKVVSPLWLERGRLSGTQYTPQNGWDENHVDFFRRHIVQLGRTGLFVVYDELEGNTDVNWNYLLHTIEQPMDIASENGGLRITGRNNDGGMSVAHLFSPQSMTYAQVDTFFVPAQDWKKRLGKKALPNHYHFTATTTPVRNTCFLNVIDVHGNNRPDAVVKRDGNRISVDNWVIECNLDGKGPAFLNVRNTVTGSSLTFNYGANNGATTVIDNIDGKKVEKRLTDALPDVVI